MFDITGKRFLFLILSEIVILIAIVALAVFGLKPGIEFSSGSLLAVSFEQEVSQSELEAELADLGYSEVIIQRTGTGQIRSTDRAGVRLDILDDSRRDRP
jgi:preprotein translocase subunit SecF